MQAWCWRMSQSAIQHILELIDELSDEDRTLVQQYLAVQADSEWQQEADSARQEAARRGIDQAAIDDAISKRRYGM